MAIESGRKGVNSAFNRFGGGMKRTSRRTVRRPVQRTPVQRPMPVHRPVAQRPAQATVSQVPAVQAKPLMAGPPVVNKPFDIKVYWQAVQLFFPDFFGQKVPWFFKNFVPTMKIVPQWFKGLPQDEQLAYGGVVVGNVMVIVGLVLFLF